MEHIFNRIRSQLEVIIEEGFSKRLSGKIESLDKKDQTKVSAWLRSQQTILMDEAKKLLNEVCDELYSKAEKVLDIKISLVRISNRNKDLPYRCQDEIEFFQEVVNERLKELDQLEKSISEKKDTLNSLKQQIQEKKDIVLIPDAKLRESLKIWKETMALAKLERDSYVRGQMIRSAGLILASANGLRVVGGNNSKNNSVPPEEPDGNNCNPF